MSTESSLLACGEREETSGWWGGIGCSEEEPDIFSVGKFTAEGDTIFETGEGGTENGQFDAPQSIAVNSKDNAVVADTGNVRVQELNGEGEFVRNYGAATVSSKRQRGSLSAPKTGSGSILLGASAAFAPWQVEECWSVRGSGDDREVGLIARNSHGWYWRGGSVLSASESASCRRASGDRRHGCN